LKAVDPIASDRLRSGNLTPITAQL